jgi:hypothetical protein
MRQAITTRYIGPTDKRGSRVKATSSGGLSFTLEWDDALDTDANHQAAAMALAKRQGWSGTWAAGADRVGNVYVNLDGDCFAV